MVRTKTIAAACLIVPVAALAQVTYNYSGELMKGTDATAAGNPYELVVTTTPIDFAASGAITLAEPLGANLRNVSVNPLSFAFQLNGSTAADIFDSVPPSVSAPTRLNIGDSFIFSTDANGAITNWNVLLNSEQEESRGVLNINYQSSLGGDSYTDQSGGFPDQYLSGKTTLSNTIAGVWSGPPSAAPEVDPAGTIGALTLLAGLVAITNGKRRRWS